MYLDEGDEEGVFVVGEELTGSIGSILSRTFHFESEVIRAMTCVQYLWNATQYESLKL
jgi:hypothetical protein